MKCAPLPVRQVCCGRWLMARGTNSGAASPNTCRARVGRDFDRRATDRHIGPLGFGVFTEVDTFCRLQREAKPGEWGRAVAIREVSVSPMPPAIALALGVDGARFAAEKIGKLPAVKRFEPFFSLIRDTIGDAAGDSDLAQVLGFDPLEVMRTLLAR